MSEDRTESIKRVELELKGKALQIYWYMLKKGKSVGTREVQRSLSYSSPSIAHHHLEKLRLLGLVRKDEYGNYFLVEHVEVGVLQAFTRVGRLMLPRFTFYAVFLLAFLILYVLQNYKALSIYTLMFGSISVAIFCYETYRVWRKRP